MDYETLVQRMLAGDRSALARLMTLVEGRGPDRRCVMSLVAERVGDTRIIGITGPPGAGKSTLLDRLVGEFRAAGHQVGIVAVDPSSPFSGGAVLGDRIRMQSHFLDEGVFIRSVSARGNVGGLARATRDMARLLAASGKGIVFVETVGVGQSEFDIMRLAQTVIVVLVPEAGDTVQTMKAGLLEIADIFVVNKSDREGAERIKAELEMMLQLRPADGWAVPVSSTVSTSGQGIPEVVAAIERHGEFLRRSGALEARASAGRREEFVSSLKEEVGDRLDRSLARGDLTALVAAVEQGTLDPDRAVIEALQDGRLLQLLLRGDN